MTRLIWVFGCFACQTHWWEEEPDVNRGHECPKGYPSGGTALGPWQPASTPPHLRAAA